MISSHILLSLLGVAMAAPVPPQSTYIASEGVETVITTAADGFSRGNTALTATSFSGSQDVLRSYSTGAGKNTVDSAALSALKAGLPAGSQQLTSFPNAETHEGPTVIAVKVEPSPILVVDQGLGREAAAAAAASTTQAPQSTQAPPSSGVGGGDSYAGFGGAGAGAGGAGAGAGVGAGLGGFGPGVGVGVGYGAGAAVAGAIILKKLLVLKALLVGAALVG
jgi:hypothetical protein